MTTITIARSIDAPVQHVFETVAHIENFEKVVPNIVRVEFLTDSRTGVGARFRETRLVRGREASTELEVTEYVPNERVRLVTDQGGTIWDTVFTTESDEERTELTMVMEARAYRWLARIMNPIVKPIVAKAVAGDIDAVKLYCEAAASSDS